jgi:hypothetical protein
MERGFGKSDKVEQAKMKEYIESISSSTTQNILNQNKNRICRRFFSLHRSDIYAISP